MTYYHESQEAAKAASTRYTDSGMWHAQFTNEPFNGWVITLYPRTKEVLKYPLYDLLQFVELRLDLMAIAPADKVRPVAISAKPKAPPARKVAPPPPPPPKPPGAPQAMPKVTAPPKPPAPPPPPPKQPG